MKTLLTILISIFSCAFAYTQNNITFDNELLVQLSQNNWKFVFDNLDKKIDKNANECDIDPTMRFLYGHAALIVGENNISTNQFYCACDSLTSKSLIDWLMFTRKFKSDYPGYISSYLLSDAFARNAQFNEAKIEIEIALKENPKFVPGLNISAVINWILYENSNPKDESYKIVALEQIQLGITINPNFADLFANKAIFTMRNVGNMSRSRLDLNKAIQIDSTYYLVQNSLAVTYGEEGILQKYEDLNFKINKYNPNTPFVKLTELGNVTKTERGTIKVITKVLPPLIKLAVVVLPPIIRGGVFTYLKEGENLQSNDTNKPVLIGTWFNFNYPNNVIIQNNN